MLSHRYQLVNRAAAVAAICSALLISACGAANDAEDNNSGFLPSSAPPTAEPTDTPSDLPPTGSEETSEPTEPPCENSSKFVADVNLPDDTPVIAGREYIKTWRLLNNGTCTWNSTYSLVQIGGTGDLYSTGSSAVPMTAPGEEAELSVTLIMDISVPPGLERQATFQLRSPSGELFGATPFTVLVSAADDGTEQTPTPTQASTGLGSIRGTVWLDHCTVTPDGTPSAECVLDNGYMANGIFESHEARMANITVSLSRNACPGTAVYQTTKTNSRGEYSFSGLDSADYCVSINALSSANESLLIPGGWTFPATSEATAKQTITLGTGQSVTGINFGWDYQFD